VDTPLSGEHRAWSKEKKHFDRINRIFRIEESHGSARAKSPYLTPAPSGRSRHRERGETGCLKSTCQHTPGRPSNQFVASLGPCCHSLKASPCDLCFAQNFKQHKREQMLNAYSSHSDGSAVFFEPEEKFPSHIIRGRRAIVLTGFTESFFQL
jgi:hypothetical protein